MFMLQTIMKSLIMSLCKVTTLLIIAFNANLSRTTGSKDIEKRDTTVYPEVSTTSGILVGYSSKESHSFYSIPYGVAPKDELRFQPPREFKYPGKVYTDSANYKRCFEYPSRCSSEIQCTNAFITYTEDCLVLNINVPASIDLTASPSERLPVMIWIHGGSFSSGAGTDPLFEGEFLCNATNTIIVTVNYRLGVLGFLYYEENGVVIFPGNQGLKDQQLAMKWIQDNIEKFGGDKNLVTLFGNSAGAQAIALHLLSSESKMLFKRAILQSYPASISLQSKTEAQVNSQTILNELNCSGSNINCSRNVSPFDLMESHGTNIDTLSQNYESSIQPFRPILDGTEFTEQPLAAFQAGRWQSNKEVIVGVTTEEIVALNMTENLTRSEFEAATTFYVGAQLAPLVIEKYAETAGTNPPVDYDYKYILGKQITDMRFTCPNKALARFMSFHQNPSSVYFYVYAYPVDFTGCPFLLHNCGSAFHGSEVFFLFKTAYYAMGTTYSANDVAVSKTFADFWGHFAYYGKPTNNESFWPAYTSKASSVGTSPWSNIRIHTPIETRVENDYKKSICNFWDSLNFYVAENSSTFSMLPTQASTANDEENQDPSFSMLSTPAPTANDEEIQKIQTTTDSSANQPLVNSFYRIIPFILLFKFLEKCIFELCIDFESV